MRKLISLLKSIDGCGYKAYKQLQAGYRYKGFQLTIDHVQGDPFADPSRCHISIALDRLALPTSLYQGSVRRVALEDFIGRRFAAAIAELVPGGRGSGRSGEFEMARYGQQVLERNAVMIKPELIEVRFQIGLPANNRRIDAVLARTMLIDELPAVVESALLELPAHLGAAERHVNCIEDQQVLRAQLVAQGLVAFIADGSLLARQSGVDDGPLGDAVTMVAPEALACELIPRHAPRLRGIGIPEGITLIVGGGFHGKSTLLRAIEQGVYDHIPGDGRERVVSVADAFKLRAEDGRSVAGIDIQPFIQNLPGAQDCASFNTGNASGSSSQAASLIEALNAGARTLLLDEDTSATNFLIRDRRMQALVPTQKEPITPLLHRIRQLRDQQGVSVILVMGGSSAYFPVADQVIMLDNYQARDVSEKARALADGEVVDSAYPDFLSRGERIPRPGCLSPLAASGKPVIRTYATRMLHYGVEELPLPALEQLVDQGQLLAIGYLIEHYAHSMPANGLEQGLREVYDGFLQQGFDTLGPYPGGKLAMPRWLELIAVVNRMRLLELENAGQR